MKHHYQVSAIMTYNARCPMGTVCEEENLKAILAHQGAKQYKITHIDRQPVYGWEASDWLSVQ